MKINTLTAAEENLMQIIWQLDSPFMKDIMEAYPEPKPHQNTISTYLKILVEKEFLATEKIGRIFRYNVLVPFTDYRNFVLMHFLEKLYHNSASELLKNLVSENLLKPSDFNELFEIKTAVVPIINKPESENSEISTFIRDLTGDKKKKEKDKKKKKRKK